MLVLSIHRLDDICDMLSKNMSLTCWIVVGCLCWISVHLLIFLIRRRHSQPLFRRCSYSYQHCWVYVSYSRDMYPRRRTCISPYISSSPYICCLVHCAFQISCLNFQLGSKNGRVLQLAVCRCLDRAVLPRLLLPPHIAIPAWYVLDESQRTLSQNVVHKERSLMLQSGSLADRSIYSQFD